MLKRYFVILLGLLLVIATTAQEESPLTLEGDGETPVIAHVSSTRDNRDYEYTEQYTDPGAVIFHDGQFHMFRNGFVGWPAPVWIHYMVSEDGITWEQASQEPVLLTDDVPFAEVAALASSVIVEDDGTWVLYFYTWNTSSGTAGEGEIGRATADNPAGPWTVDAEPVLSFGEAGELDASGVSSPHVIRTEDGYRMYYDAISAENNNARTIALAMSEDGITWEKFADNPVLAPVADWEGTLMHQARVLSYGDGYLMIYRGAIRGQGLMRIGVATSADSISWERADEPILDPDMLDNHNAFWFTSTAQTEDTAYLFIELMPASNVTDIFTMTVNIDDLASVVGE